MNTGSIPHPLLAHSVIAANGGEKAPARYMLFLHGVFGAGANWRSFARKFVNVAAPFGWGAVLVDLRLHGGSQAFVANPPQTVVAAASDLLALHDALPGPVEGVIGHSLGGKIALDYVRQRAGDLDVAWVLDATPGARPTARGSESIATILDALTHAGPTWASREAFIAEIEAAGVSRALGPWLAMNLRNVDGHYALRLDLDAIRALLADYWVTDLWPVLEAPPGRVRTHVVVAGKSRVFDAAERERLARVAASSNGHVQAHTLENASHWLHVDDPDGLFALIAGGDGNPSR